MAQAWREALLDEGFRMYVAQRPGDIREPLLFEDNEGQVWACLCVLISPGRKTCVVSSTQPVSTQGGAPGQDNERPERPKSPSFRRLLSVARGEAIWIACGLFALLCRLPFSLAVSHYVSVAIAGALSGDHAEAAVRLDRMCRRWQPLVLASCCSSRVERPLLLRSATLSLLRTRATSMHHQRSDHFMVRLARLALPNPRRGA